MEAKSSVLRMDSFMPKILTPEAWAHQQFGDCELGDVRRTRRLVKFAQQVCHKPSQNTPMQTQTWGDCKAAYRLMSREEVTFEAITSPHYQLTRDQSPEVCLLLNDLTEIDFGYDSVAQGLAPVGNGSCGFLMQNSLAVKTDGRVIGLAGQKLRHRKPKPKNETRTERLKRDRESLLWGQLVAQVGPPPEGVQWINVCDRGADDFEFWCRMAQQKHDWVVRASKLQRSVLQDGESLSLREKLDVTPFDQQYYVLNYRSKKHGARTATMQVRFCEITVQAPKLRSPWLKEQAIPTLKMFVVEAVEENPPQGVPPLRWVLLSSIPVKSFSDAWTIIEYYEKRWIVEEFHKALKTGCRVEERQYRTSDRLEAIAGLLSIVAVRLLELRSASKTTPDRAAHDLIPTLWISALKALRPKAKVASVGDFYRQLAGLGGHLLRKSDGDPGWLTIWRGFSTLQTAVTTIANYEKCG